MYFAKARKNFTIEPQKEPKWQSLVYRRIFWVQESRDLPLWP